MNKEIKPLQVYFLTSGFETENYYMYSGRFITIQSCGKRFSFAQQFEGTVYVAPLTFELDDEFEEALLENSVLYLDHVINDSLPLDNIIVRPKEEDPMTTYTGLSDAGGDLLKIGYGDDSVPKIANLTSKVEKPEGSIRAETIEESNPYQIAFARPQPEALENITEVGATLVHIGGFLPTFGQTVTVEEGGIVQVKDETEGDKVQHRMTLDDTNAWQFMRIDNLATASSGLRKFRYTFRTDEVKPALTLFSEEGWYDKTK